MILMDCKGNELVEILDIDEHSAMGQYAPVTHCLAVVMAGDDYLLGWNRWRKEWETFGGCMEQGGGSYKHLTLPTEGGVGELGGGCGVTKKEEMRGSVGRVRRS